MLVNIIQEDLRFLRMNNTGNNVKINFLRTLLGDLQKAEKDGQELTDQFVTKVVKKFVKNAEDSMKHLDKSDPRYADYEAEVNYLSGYLPKQLNEDQVVRIIREQFGDGPVNIGAAMKFLKEQYGDSVDGKVASKAIKDNF